MIPFFEEAEYNWICRVIHNVKEKTYIFEVLKDGVIRYTITESWISCMTHGLEFIQQKIGIPHKKMNRIKQIMDKDN